MAKKLKPSEFVDLIVSDTRFGTKKCWVCHPENKEAREFIAGVEAEWEKMPQAKNAAALLEYIKDTYGFPFQIDALRKHLNGKCSGRR